MMRTKLTLVAASLATLLMSTAHAANDTADLTISANVVPSACNFSVADDGTWDYGDRPFASLDFSGTSTISGDGTTTWTAKPASLQCNAPTLIKIKTVDNRLGTAMNARLSSFGLGVDESGGRIGRTHFSAVDVYMDGTPAYSVVTYDNINWRLMGQGGSELPSNLIERGDSYFSFSPNLHGPSPVTNVTWDMINETVIEEKIKLDGSRPILLNGSATMELFYI